MMLADDICENKANDMKLLWNMSTWRLPAAIMILNYNNISQTLSSVYFILFYYVFLYTI
jgi:hypothetical protein